MSGLRVTFAFGYLEYRFRLWIFHKTGSLIQGEMMSTMYDGLLRWSFEEDLREFF
jgi:hypothetical protein